MCVSLEARIAMLRQPRRPLDMEVSKTFTPTTEEDPNYRAFFRDCQGMEKVLVYGGQSVYERFKAEYDAIQDLEGVHRQVLDAVDSPDNQQLSDQINDEIMRLNNELKEKIKVHFTEFVAEKLGPDRVQIAPEIFYRFSQKALTSLNTEVSRHTEKTLNKIFYDSKNKSNDRCELIFTDDPKYPVKIVTKSKKVFDQYQPYGKLEMLPLATPIQFSAIAVYTVGADEVTRGAMRFSLHAQPKR